MCEVRPIEYEYDKKTYQGFYSATEDQKKRPVVLIFAAWKGLDEFVKEKIKYIFSLGYFAFGVDLYGKNIVGNSDEECLSLMSPLIQNRSKILKITEKAIEKIKSMPTADSSKIASIGFCFGGLCSLDMARNFKDWKGAVSFHGLLDSDGSNSKCNSKILALHGYKDPMVTFDDVLKFQKEMEERKADFQFVVYGDAYHAFTNPTANSPKKGTVYHQKASQRAFLLMEAFLKECFNE